MTENATKPDPAATPKRTTRRRGRRVLRLSAGVVALLALVLGAAFFLATRSWFIIMVVQPALEERLGGPMQIGRAVYRGDGAFVFHDVTLDAPGVAGAARHLAELDRMVVIVDDEALWNGQVVLTNVEVSGLDLRLSEDRNEAGSMNFMTLRPRWVRRVPVLPPTVVIRDVTIEVGMHDGESYENMAERTFTGAMHPVEGEEGWFTYELEEIGREDAGTDDEMLFISGRCDLSTLAFNAIVRGLALSEDTYGMCPSLVRFWWEQMDLEGRVHRVDVSYEPGGHVSVAMALEAVALSLPVDTKGMWSIYEPGEVVETDHRPRLYVDRGTVELSPAHVALEDLVGTVGSRARGRESAGVPYRGSFRMSELPEFDWSHRKQWLDEVVNAAPFRLDFEIEDFVVSSDAEGRTEAVELPTPIARLFDGLNLRQWALDSQFSVWREAMGEKELASGDDEGGAGRVEVEGEVRLSRAEGAFEPFPYPLHDVTAQITFDSDEARIVRLSGNGADGAVVDITGRIAPLGRDPGVEIALKARHLATNDTLREALSEKRRAVYDAFFHQPSFEALRRSGLLDDASAFEFGGTMDLDLHFDRPPGEDRDLIVSGEVRVGRLGVIQESFPYPITIEGGRITIAEDRIRLRGVGDERGLPLRTPGGGRGYASGDVTFVRHDETLEIVPDLHISVERDAFSDLLFASVPLTTQERAQLEAPADWPGATLSRTARLLKGLGLDGRLDYDGRIRKDDADQVDYDFNVTLDGAATPEASLAEAVGTAGLLWPEGFSLEDVRGELRIRRDAIELRQFTGREADNVVSATGAVDLASPDAPASLHVQFERLELGPYLINLAPAESAARVRDVWQQYRPGGHFGLDLVYESDGEKDRLELIVVPRDVSLTLDDRRAMLQCTGGDIRLADGRVRFNDLALDLSSEQRDDGSLVLDGAYSPGEVRADLFATGKWRDGRLESPLVPEVLHLIGANAQIRHYRALAPAGTFDASFSYESPRSDRDRHFSIAIAPRTVTATLNERTVDAVLDDGGRVLFEPDTILVQNMVGALPSGRFHLDGRVDLAGDVEIVADLEYDGRLRGTDIEALLPRRIREWAETVEYADDEGSALRKGQLRLREVPGKKGPAWALDFTGEIETRNASIKLGTDLSEIRGAYIVGLRQRPGQWPDLEIDARVDRMLINRREITDLTAFAYLDQASETMRVPLIQSESHGGKISGSAVFGVGDESTYDVQFDMVGVGLDGILRPSPEQVSTAPAAPAEAEGSAEDQLFGTFRMTGIRGRPETRVGRGMVRAIGTRVAAMPLVLRLVQILQGIVPIGGDLDYADAPFFIQGDRLVFEDVVIENSIGNMAPVQIFGSGSMTLKDFELAMRFQVRTWTPFMREILQPIGDQILGIQVNGPLNDPKVSLVPLPGLNHTAAGNGSRAASAPRVVAAEPPPAEPDEP